MPRRHGHDEHEAGEHEFFSQHAGGFHEQHSRPDHSWLVESAGRDNWGFQDQLLVVQNNPLVNINLPTHMARQWTVTVQNMRFRGTNGLFISNTLPTDNQVAALSGFQPFQLVASWGVAGGREQVIMDYPWGGCTFDVYGAQLTVAMSLSQAQLANLTAPSTPLPIVGAFAAPSVGRYFQRGVGGAVYTAAPQLVSAGATAIFPVPARARTYQLVQFSGTAAAGAVPFFIQQRGSNQTGQLQIAEDARVALGAASADAEMAGGGTTPGLVLSRTVGATRLLESACQVVEVTGPSDMVGNVDVYLRFGLDLC
jgi:hypothetical protein